MVFVLFTLPVALTGVSLALKAGNRILDYVDSVRGVRAEQKRCRETTGGQPVHVVVEMVTDASTAEEILHDPRVVQGRETARHFRNIGAI